MKSHQRRLPGPAVFAATALLTLLALSALSCTEAPKPDPSGEAVTIGAVFNLTGEQAFFGMPSLRGARLAIQEINDEGGVLGAPIELVVKDGESSPEILATRTAETVGEYPALSAMMGLSDSDMVMGAAAVSAAEQRVFITSGATAPQLVDEVPEYLFLACFGDNVQAAAAAQWARGNGIRTVAVLYDSSWIYTRNLRRYFETRFKELGGEVVSSEDFTSTRHSGDETLLTKQADAVFLSAETAGDAIKVISILRDEGFKGIIIGGDGYDDASAWAGLEISDVVYTTHVYLGDDSTDPLVTRFRDAYVKANPGQLPTAFSALAYDTVHLLAHAVAKAGRGDPEAVRSALADTRDFEGVTGTISYGRGNRIPRKSVTLIRVDAGRTQFLERVFPERVPAP